MFRLMTQLIKFDKTNTLDFKIFENTYYDGFQIEKFMNIEHGMEQHKLTDAEHLDIIYTL